MLDLSLLRHPQPLAPSHTQCRGGGAETGCAECGTQLSAVCSPRGRRTTLGARAGLHGDVWLQRRGGLHRQPARIDTLHSRPHRLHVRTKHAHVSVGVCGLNVGVAGQQHNGVAGSGNMRCSSHCRPDNAMHQTRRQCSALRQAHQPGQGDGPDGPGGRLRLFELLKNAMRAAAEAHRGRRGQPLPPIVVRICEAPRSVTLRISDQACTSSLTYLS